MFKKTTSVCFATLRQLRQIRHSVPSSTLQTLVVSLVLNMLDFGKALLVGLPAYLIRRLQAVQNVSARLIHQLRRFDHISNTLVSLHWQRVPGRIEYKIAVLIYKVLHGLAPRYLGPLTRVADLPGRGALLPASTNRLHIPPVRLSTVGTRAFSVAGPSIWNNLPEDITSSGTLYTFCHRLKMHLFQRNSWHLFASLKLILSSLIEVLAVVIATQATLNTLFIFRPTFYILLQNSIMGATTVKNWETENDEIRDAEGIDG